VAYVKYLFKTVYPVDLAVLYPLPKTTPWEQIAGAMVVLAAISFLVWRMRVSKPCLLTGWLWYLGMLVPVIGVVQVGDQAMADRYTYLPQIGLCIALAWGAAQFTAAWPRTQFAYAAVSALVVLGLMACAWRQTSYWRDSETLWRRSLDEARERLKILGIRDEPGNELVELQEQVMKLSVALAEARAREGEQLTHLARLSKERETLRTERGSLLALLKSTQALLEQQNARVAALEQARTKELSAPTNPARSRVAKREAARDRRRHGPAKRSAGTRKKSRPRKPK